MAREGTPASYRFSRSARLTRPAEYGRVFAGAERIADRHFTILIAPNDLSWPRLGLTVSRRAAPRAVARNRIKRLIRETFRHHRPRLGAVDAVVIAKPPARDAAKSVLRGALTRLWQRVAERCDDC